MTDMQTRLAEPFPASEVRQFKKEWTTKAGERKSAGPFDFIEDETVMDRLDEVVGLGNWYVHVNPISDTAVRVVLGVKLADSFVEYEDFGYATRADSAEPLKEAVSDGIRRCGRYVGIARYLYRKHDANDIAVATAQAEVRKAAEGDGLIGTAEIGKAPADFELRETPDDGYALAFRLVEGRKGFRVDVIGPLAMAVYAAKDDILDKRVTCWGSVRTEHFTPKGTQKKVPYQVLVLERLSVGDLHLPADGAVPSSAELPDDSATSAEPHTPASGSSPDAGGSTPDSEFAGDTGPSESERVLRDSKDATSDAGEEEAPASKAGASGVGASADLCGAESPYGDGETCDLLRGHRGVHKRVSAPIPTSWGTR